MKRFILLLLFLLASCFREKELTIEFPYEPKPVFYGFLGNEDGSSVSAFESIPLTIKEPFYPLFSGQAYLIENGVFVDTFIIDQNGVLRSTYRIRESSDYQIHFKDQTNSYKSDEVLLPEKNKIIDHILTKIEDSGKAILELNFEFPFDSGNEINLFSNTERTELKSSFQSSEDRKKVYVRFDYINSILGPSNEIIRYDTIDVLKVKANYFSFEKSKFSESRKGSGEVINAGSNFHNPVWSNIENAYGYVTGYVSDSLIIEL